MKYGILHLSQNFAAWAVVGERGKLYFSVIKLFCKWYLKFLLVTHTTVVTPYIIHKTHCHSNHHCCWLLLILPVLLNQQHPVTSVSQSTPWEQQFALLQPHSCTSRICHSSIVQEVQLNGVCWMYHSWNYAGYESRCISVRKQVGRGSMQPHHWEGNINLRHSFKFHLFIYFYSKYSLFLFLKHKISIEIQEDNHILWIRSQDMWQGQFIIYRRESFLTVDLNNSIYLSYLNIEVFKVI